MRGSAIRHLAITDDSAVVAAAFFEKRVQIWSWKTKQQLGEFETKLDFGGERLALTPDGRICIAASFHRRLAAYSVPDGRALWMKTDLGQVQYVTLSASGREIYCGIESSSLLIIETETGATIQKVRGASKVFASQVSPHLLVARKDKFLVQGANQVEIPAISFGLISAAFSPDAVCLSEPRTGVRCMDLASGSLLWHHETIGANHLVFSPADNRFYCVGTMNPAQENVSLIRLASSLMDCDSVTAMRQSWTAAFSPSGAVVVTVDGEVYETATGGLIALLDFPQRDYPDA